MGGFGQHTTLHGIQPLKTTSLISTPSPRHRRQIKHANHHADRVLRSAMQQSDPHKTARSPKPTQLAAKRGCARSTMLMMLNVVQDLSVTASAGAAQLPFLTGLMCVPCTTAGPCRPVHLCLWCVLHHASNEPSVSQIEQSSCVNETLCAA